MNNFKENEMMKRNKFDEIKEYDAEYASEVMSSIPIGYIDKTATGIGLTSLALENEEDTIILVPNISLVVNKADQYPNKRSNYKVLGVWGEVDKKDVKKYLREVKGKQPIKIISTFDGAWKLEGIFKDCKIIIDESQKILDLAKGVRRGSIIRLLDILKENKERVSFISATPIDTKFLPKWIGDLPQIKMKWKNTIIARPILVERTYPLKALRDEFIKPLNTQGELNIAGVKFKSVIVFVNSVTTIQTVIRDCGLDFKDCAVMAGETIRNNKRLAGVKRYEVGDKVKFLFVTSTGFQGIDLYLEDSITIAVSSTTKDYMMMDLKTDLRQAISRNRCKTNPNYGKYIFIYNQSLFNKTEEEVLSIIEGTEIKIDNAIPYINGCIEKGVGYSADDEVLEYTYIGKDGFFVKNDMAFNADRRFILETRNQFTKGFEVAGVTGKIAEIKPIELPKDITYRDLVKYFKENHKNGKIDWGVYSTKYDWILVIESLYNLTKKIVEDYTYAKQLLDVHGDSYKELILELRRSFKVGRYSNKEVREILQKIYDKDGLDRKAKPNDLYEIFGNGNVKPYVYSGTRGMEILRK